MEVLKFLADIGNSEINSGHRISRRGYLYSHKSRNGSREVICAFHLPPGDFQAPWKGEEHVSVACSMLDVVC